MALPPKKLKKDAIEEALFEVRFSTSDYPEYVLGKLSSTKQWSKHIRTQLPLANIPATMREADQNLRNQPVLEFRAKDGSHTIRLGERVLSFHSLKPYPGWKTFRRQLTSLSKLLFSSSFKNLAIERLGLRYVNFFKKRDHGVSGTSDLNFSVLIDSKTLSCPMNLNYQKPHGRDYLVIVKISSRELITPVPEDLTAFVDIDVFTPEKFSAKTAAELNAWLDRAHEIEKLEFFNLFTKPMLKTLVEAKK